MSEVLTLDCIKDLLEYVKFMERQDAPEYFVFLPRRAFKRNFYKLCKFDPDMPRKKLSLRRWLKENQRVGGLCSGGARIVLV